MPQHFAVRSPWLRGMLAVLAALTIAIAGFLLLAFILPAAVMGATLPWVDRPVGSGMFFVVTVPPAGILSIVALVMLTRVIYSRLSP